MHGDIVGMYFKNIKGLGEVVFIHILGGSIMY